MVALEAVRASGPGRGSLARALPSAAVRISRRIVARATVRVVVRTHTVGLPQAVLEAFALLLRIGPGAGGLPVAFVGLGLLARPRLALRVAPLPALGLGALLRLGLLPLPGLSLLPLPGLGLDLLLPLAGLGLLALARLRFLTLPGLGLGALLRLGLRALS